MRITKLFPENIDKLKELIHYLAEKCADKPSFGATLLNKLLFYSDFYHYAKHRRLITNVVYWREAFGIVPKHLLEAKEQLEKEEKIAVEHREYYGRTQNRIVPRKPFVRERLSDEELRFVDSIVDRFGDLGAKEISDLNHNEIPFQHVGFREEVSPNMAYFLGDATKIQIPPEVIQKAIKSAKELGYKFLPTNGG